MNNTSVKEQYLSNLPKLREFHDRMHSLMMAILSPLPYLHKVESRIKSLDSIEAKLTRRGKKDLDDLFDVVGFRIIVATEKDITNIFNLLISELKIYEANCYNGHFYADKDYFEKLPFHVNFMMKAFPVDAIYLYSGIGSKRLKLPEWNQFSDCRAEIQIITVFGQAYIEATHALNYKDDGNVKLDILELDVSSRLNFAINKFSELIDSDNVHEKRDIHPFINKHSFLLHPNPAEFFSEVAIGLGTEFRIDFLVRESDGKYLLVEIENSRHPLFTKSGDFSSQLNHAIRQVEDWQQWIEDNLSTVQKKYPDMISPSALVIIGRSNNLSTEERQRLERRNINFRGKIVIWTYDHLIENAKSFIESIKTNLRNWT